MQKVYLSKTQSGKFGLFTGNMLVMSLGKSLHDTLLSNRVEFKELCAGLNFEPALYCDHCNKLISLDSIVNLCIACYEVHTKKTTLEKIYFTVKADTNTYYYESDCLDSLAKDLDHIDLDIFINQDTHDHIDDMPDLDITYSNVKPYNNSDSHIEGML